MVKWFLAREEKSLGVPLEYLRDLSRNSTALLFKIGRINRLGRHRQHLPKEAWHLARLATVRVEGCGDCVQIVINHALRDGLSRDLVQAALSTDLDLLPMDLALTMRFAETIAKHSDNEYLRNRLVRIFGSAAFDELALAIASARFIPTLKRALGHSQNCTLIQVPAEPIEMAA